MRYYYRVEMTSQQEKFQGSTYQFYYPFKDPENNPRPTISFFGKNFYYQARNVQNYGDPESPSAVTYFVYRESTSQSSEQKQDAVAPPILLRSRSTEAILPRRIKRGFASSLLKLVRHEQIKGDSLSVFDQSSVLAAQNYYENAHNVSIGFPLAWDCCVRSILGGILSDISFNASGESNHKFQEFLKIITDFFTFNEHFYQVYYGEGQANQFLLPLYPNHVLFEYFHFLNTKNLKKHNDNTWKAFLSEHSAFQSVRIADTAFLALSFDFKTKTISFADSGSLEKRIFVKEILGLPAWVIY